MSGGEPLRSKGWLIDGPVPQVWAVVNVTPDSFSDGGRHYGRDAALAGARSLLAEGADVLDVGGESSRPAGSVYGEGAAPVSQDEELARVVPVVEALTRELEARVSVDTVKPEVARRALRAGASIVNDVSGGADPELLRVVGDSEAELVLMHNRRRGEVDEVNTRYRDVVWDVMDELGEAVARAEQAGVARERVWLDPGLGFAKTPGQSAELLARTDELLGLGQRLLVGASRKSFLGVLAPNADGQRPSSTQRLGASIAASLLAVQAGAHAVRVHDVGPVRQAVRFVHALSVGHP
jgi:dihydropteroate synthase